MDAREAVVDLRATVDYLADLIERADTFDFDAATDLRDEALSVQARAKDLVSLLETGMLRQLEAGSRERGGRVWARVRKYVDRTDHALVAGAVRQAALNAYRDPDTGEVTSAEAAVAEAVRLMGSLYVSPSSDVKRRPLAGIGLDARGVVQREFQKYGLDITDLDPGRTA